MGKTAGAVRDFWVDHLWLDYVIAASLLGLHLAGVIWWQWPDPLGAASAPDRRAVYSAAAIVVSLLGSFSAVAIGQLSSAKGARADALREVGGTDLAKNWRGIFRTAMLCALVALFALLLDPSIPSTAPEPEPTPIIIRWIFEACLLLAVVRFVRLSALFVEVLEVASLADASGAKPLASAPTPDPKWAERRRAANGL